MISGYMGKLLWVDLSSGKIQVEQPDDEFYRKYIGGYGIGSRLLYDHMKAECRSLRPGQYPRPGHRPGYRYPHPRRRPLLCRRQIPLNRWLG